MPRFWAPKGRWIGGTAAEALQTGASALVLAIPIRLTQLKLVIGDRQHPVSRDRSLTTALARGFGWYEELRAGAAASIGAIAERDNDSSNLVRRYIDLALLPTDLGEATEIAMPLSL